MIVFGFLLVKLFPDILETDAKVWAYLFLLLMAPVVARFHSPNNRKKNDKGKIRKPW